ncbi:hypothetical protein GCM10011490_22780 [Pseudoclavibacter endophyticus]|uniref:response regulator transcription factor n=1 Tax=Pseudoclavibacter endophyticus TaxID=1778590 RepID=UPI0016678352|nr:response regulator [Pseudoclavibacter endophyticus]GGA71522.1 hypothetical protein GCM10011490_22780 [Pseudoclavibacter endophyticus]
MRRVVIAEDDADIRSLIEIAARRAGLEIVSTHGDGMSALAAARASDPDLLVLDVSMPEMTGLEVLQQLRAERDDTRPRALVVSASADEPSRSAGELAGADAYVTKPFTVRDLTSRLSDLAARQ